MRDYGSGGGGGRGRGRGRAGKISQISLH